MRTDEPCDVVPARQCHQVYTASCYKLVQALNPATRHKIVMQDTIRHQTKGDSQAAPRLYPSFTGRNTASELADLIGTSLLTELSSAELQAYLRAKQAGMQLSWPLGQVAELDRTAASVDVAHM